MIRADADLHRRPVATQVDDWEIVPHLAGSVTGGSRCGSEPGSPGVVVPPALHAAVVQHSAGGIASG